MLYNIKMVGVIWTNYFCIIVIVWAVKRDLYSLNNSIK